MLLWLGSELLGICDAPCVTVLEWGRVVHDGLLAAGPDI